MERIIRDYVAIVADLFELPEPIWDIGSYQVAGQEELVNLRDVFAGRDFVGVDMREGPGVDRVENVVQVGQTVQVKVISVDVQRRRVGLSLKQA